MKKITILLAVAAACYLLFGSMNAAKKIETNSALFAIQYEQVPQEDPINIALWQDVSRSTLTNGVELIRSSIFKPYFEDIYRDIELHFGIINGNTAHKLISVELPKALFKKPIRPDLGSISMAERDALQKSYTQASNAYKHDSARFFSDRIQRFQQFCSQVDSTLEPYREKLSSSTDLIPIFKITDKVFNFSFAGPAQNFILVNSDGLDSRHRSPEPLKNKATIILINANGLLKTSIDAVISKTMQSTEQAIQYSISNHN